MAFKTFTAASALTASEVNTYLMGQAWIICTSGTRPTSTEGRPIYETDTDKVYIYNGAWCEVMKIGAWSTWTYTSGGVTKGGGTSTGGFCRVGGRLISFRFSYTLGSGGLSVSGAAQMTLPVTAGTYLGTQFHGEMIDASTGARYQGYIAPFDSNTVLMYVADTTGSYVSAVAPTTTVPFSWTTGDQWEISGTYEAAAS